MPQTVKLAALWLTFWRRLVLGTVDGEGRGGRKERGRLCHGCRGIDHPWRWV